MPRNAARRASHALICASTLLAAVAAEAQALPCGSVVTGPVTLAADVVCGPGRDALIVGGHKVRIELNGFSIRGPATPSSPNLGTAGVRSSGFESVELVGPGSVAGFGQAIEIEGGTNHIVSGLDAFAASGLPVSVRNASGVLVEFSRMNAFELVSTPGSKAVANRIVANEVAPPPGVPGAGLVLRGCGTADNVVAHNYVNPGTRRAITLTAGAHANQVLGNKVVQGDVFLDGATNSLVADNSIYNAGFAYAGVVVDASLDPVKCAGGMQLLAAQNIVRGNRFRGGSIGVIVDDTTHSGVATANVVTGNTFSGLDTVALIFGPGSTGNDGRRNTYLNNFADVYDYGTNNLWP